MLTLDKVLTLADIARRLGVSRQAIKNRQDRGTLPEPAVTDERGSVMWKESDLIAAGVLRSTAPDAPTGALRAEKD